MLQFCDTLLCCSSVIPCYAAVLWYLAMLQFCDTFAMLQFCDTLLCCSSVIPCYAAVLWYLCYAAVLRYLIAVQTGRQRSAGASEGWISVNLIGRNGDTGQQLLQRPLSNPADKMVSGKLDVYMLEAVSVGTLQSLRLVFEGKGKGQSVREVCIDWTTLRSICFGGWKICAATFEHCLFMGALSGILCTPCDCFFLSSGLWLEHFIWRMLYSLLW